MTENEQGPARTIVLQSVELHRTAKCRGCRAPIRWARTAKGKPICLEARARPQPLTTGGFSVSSDLVHWANCRAADQFRRDAHTAPSERID